MFIQIAGRLASDLSNSNNVYTFLCNFKETNMLVNNELFTFPIHNAILDGFSLNGGHLSR